VKRLKDVALVESKAEATELKILLKGYEEPIPQEKPAPDEEPKEPVSPAQIAVHLFKSLKGSNNLVFPNSRRDVERYTHLLNKLCEQQSVPSEFWPHHGSLSKEIRADTEAALKQKERPATAICTNTLELGIDIGAVKSVAQVCAPPSVASLRQRLGRSGRRKGEPWSRKLTLPNSLKCNVSTDVSKPSCQSTSSTLRTIVMYEARLTRKCVYPSTTCSGHLKDACTSFAKRN